MMQNTGLKGDPALPTEEPEKFIVRDMDTLAAVIRGIATPARLEEYLDAEVDRDGGPRKPILGLLNKQRQRLENAEVEARDNTMNVSRTCPECGKDRVLSEQEFKEVYLRTTFDAEMGASGENPATEFIHSAATHICSYCANTIEVE